MSAGCAACGDCCDPVTIAADAYLAVTRDARSGEAIHANEAFIAQHWHPLSAWAEDDGTWLAVRCDMFDPGTRLCAARESRPPVCRDYPWYGREPGPGRIPYRHCSYLADLPPDQREPGSRPLIPITVIPAREAA